MYSRIVDRCPLMPMSETGAPGDISWRLRQFSGLTTVTPTAPPFASSGCCGSSSRICHVKSPKAESENSTEDCASDCAREDEVRVVL
jgi:hypothetical protein